MWSTYFGNYSHHDIIKGMKNMTTKLVGIAVLGVFAFFLSTVTKNIPAKPDSQNQAQAVNAEPTSETPSDTPIVTKFSEQLSAVVAPKYLDDSTLKSCLANKTIAESITVSSEFSGSKGTPLIYIGNKNIMYEIQGALPYEWFGYIINDLKAGKEFAIPKEAAENITKITNKEILSKIAITASDSIRGNQNGSISIVEYSDISCPFCQRVHPTLIKIVNDFKDTKWVYRHHPLISIHKHALEESIAAECIRLNKGALLYWKFMDEIMLKPISY